MSKLLQILLFIILILAVVFIVLPELGKFRNINSNTDNYVFNTDNMQIVIAEFKNEGTIPLEYGCKGQNLAPLIAVNGVPREAKSLVLIMDDPDAPVGRWFHWLIWNLPVDIKVIDRDNLPPMAVIGENSSGNNTYDGPCPPYGTHRYYFKLYALNKILELDPSTQGLDLEKELEGSIISRAEYMGTYSK
jgi:hypothetical protein